MKTRITLSLLLLLAVAVTAADKPNILFIISDDQAWSDYGFMGHKQIATPHLDRLAAEGLTFTRAHNIADVDHPTRSLQNRWIIAGDWKLIVPDPRNVRNAKPELYQLKQDPWERENLADAEPERVKRLRSRLDEWWTP
jgi:arylsulfatase A-like enzyme